MSVTIWAKRCNLAVSAYCFCLSATLFPDTDKPKMLPYVRSKF